MHSASLGPKLLPFTGVVKQMRRVMRPSAVTQHAHCFAGMRICRAVSSSERASMLAVHWRHSAENSTRRSAGLVHERCLEPRACRRQQ